LAPKKAKFVMLIFGAKIQIFDKYNNVVKLSDFLNFLRILPCTIALQK